MITCLIAKLSYPLNKIRNLIAIQHDIDCALKRYEHHLFTPYSSILRNSYNNFVDQFNKEKFFFQRPKRRL